MGLRRDVSLEEVCLHRYLKEKPEAGKSVRTTRETSEKKREGPKTKKEEPHNHGLLPTKKVSMV